MSKHLVLSNNASHLQNTSVGDLSEYESLSEETKEYLSFSKAKNTQRAYGADWKHFVDWCKENDEQSLPASASTVANYLTFLANIKIDQNKDGMKTKTIVRKKTAISQVHELYRLENPTVSFLVRETIKGIKRKRAELKDVRGYTSQQLPLTKDLLVQILGLIRSRLVGHPKYDRLLLRDQALLLVGFTGAFRRSELVGIDVEHISFFEEGIRIYLPYSKTDQEGNGATVDIGYGGNVETCPIRNLQKWLDAAGITSGPIFRGLDRHGNIRSPRLSGNSVNEIVKKWLDEIDRNPVQYGAHSLRAGFITSAMETSNADELATMKHTRHKSLEVFRSYRRHERKLQNNITSKLGL